MAHQGKVYAGTKGGIRVIDPVSLKETDFTNLDGLLDCWITGLAETGDGNLWAVSRSGYVSTLSGNRWTAYGQSYAAQQWLMNDRAVVAAGQYLFLGSEKGLTLFDPAYQVSRANLHQFADKLDLSVLSLLRRNDTLYVGTPQGVYKAGIDFSNPLNPATKYRNITDPGIWTLVSLPATSPARQYNFLAFVGGTLATFGTGMLLQDPVHVEAFSGQAATIGAKHFNNLTNLTSALAVNGGLFLGGVTGISYSSSPLSASPTVSSLPNISQFPTDTLYSISVHNASLWSQSMLGVYKMDPATGNAVSSVSLFGVPTPEITVDHLRNLKAGNHGDVYVGSWGLGLVRSLNGQKRIWNGSSNSCIVDVIPGYNVVSAVSNFSGNHFFFSVFKGGNGTTHQLVHLDTARNSITCMDSEVPGFMAHSIRFFSDTLLGVASDRGVAVYKVREGPSFPVLTSMGLWTTPGSANETWALASDRWERPWALAGDQLAYIDSLDSPSKKFKILDGFSGSECFSLDKDPQGSLWVGCGNGLFHVDPGPTEGATIEHFGLADGLLGLSISDVSVDPTSGHVWVATDRGVSMLESSAQPPVSGLQTVSVYPNPFRPQHRYVIFDNLPRDATVRIHSAGGNVVRIFRPGNLAGNQAQWDGANEHGKPVAAGVYLYSVTSGSSVERGKIIVAH